MDQNNLIAELIPQYQIFLSDQMEKEEKAAAKLRPQHEAESGDVEPEVEAPAEEIIEEDMDEIEEAEAS